MNKVERALLAADKAHANQSYDIYPYGYHFRQVKRIAEELGYDESIVVSCILHDTLEDTDLSYKDLKKAFGEEVAEIVFCVTDELGRNRKEKKMKTYPKIKSNWKATVVKVCDRIANMQQSKEYNENLFKMYQKEYSDLVDNIKSDAHPQNEVGKAWKRLEELVGETFIVD